MRPVQLTSTLVFVLFQISVQAQTRYVALETFNQGTSISAGGATMHDGSDFYQVYSKGSPGAYSGVIARYSNDGDLIWSKELDLGASVHLCTISERDAGGLLLGGTIQHNGRETPFIARLNPDGTLVWAQKYPGSVNASINKIIELPNGNIVLVGETNQWEYPGDAKNLIIVVCNASGNLITQKYHTTTRNYGRFNSALPADNGDFIVCGRSGHNWDYHSGIVMRFNSNGQQIWKKEFRVDLPSGNYNLWNPGSRTGLTFRNIKALGNDRYLLAGHHSDQSQYGTDWTFYHPAFITIDGNGSIQSEFELNADLRFFAMDRLANGNFVMGGFQATSLNGRLMEMALNGSVVSHTEFTMPNTQNHLVWEISNSSNGTCLISGANYLNGSFRNFALIDKISIPTYCNRSNQSFPQILSLGIISELNHALVENQRFDYESLTGQSAFSCDEQTDFFCGITMDTLRFDMTVTKCGSEIFLHLFGDIPTDSGTSLTWDYGDGSTGLLKDSSHTYPSAGSYWVKLIKQRAHCTTVIDSQLVEAETVRIDSIGPRRLCNGLGEYVKAFGQYDSLIWMPGETRDSVFAGSGGIYSFRAYSGGCMYEDSVEIKNISFNPNLPDSSFFCGGQGVDLQVNQGDSILWDNGSTDRLRQVSVSGLYKVKVYSSSCLFYDSAFIDGFDFSLGADMESCDPLPELIGHFPGDADSYQWNTGESDPVISVGPEGGLFVLTATKDTCKLVDSIYLKQLENPTHIIIPNVFTPDGDDYNETYKWDLGGEVYDFSVSVFNRYAQKVFHSNDQYFEWNGGLNNSGHLPAGVYYVIIEYRLPCGAEPIKYTGTVTKIH